MRGIKGFVLGIGVCLAGAGLATAGMPRPVINDFDGDGRSDQGFYGSFGSEWQIWLSGGGAWDTNNVRHTTFGFQRTAALPGDFDGDGLADYAVFYPYDRTWYLGRTQAGYTNFAFGYAGAAPVTGDFDGDGRTDVGCFEPARGLWTLRQSSAGVTTLTAGVAGSLPVVADYDGDGHADAAAYRPDDGLWQVRLSGSGSLWTTNFGPMTLPDAEGNRPMPLAGDYDGDGRADLAVLAGDYSVKSCYLLQSTQGRTNRTIRAREIQAGDYDGDGRTDLLWRFRELGDPVPTISINPNRPDQYLPPVPFSFYSTLIGSTHGVLDRHDFSWFNAMWMYYTAAPMTPLFGTTARGRSFRLVLPPAFSRAAATFIDASGGKATAYPAGFDDKPYFDSAGTAKTGPITFAARSVQVQAVPLYSYGTAPFKYYVNLNIAVIEGVYRDNAGETSATLIGAYIAVDEPSFNF